MKTDSHPELRKRLVVILCERAQSRVYGYTGNPDVAVDRSAIEMDVSRMSDDAVAELIEKFESAPGYVW